MCAQTLVTFYPCTKAGAKGWRHLIVIDGKPPIDFLITRLKIDRIELLATFVKLATVPLKTITIIATRLSTPALDEMNEVVRRFQKRFNRLIPQKQITGGLRDRNARMDFAVALPSDFCRTLYRWNGSDFGV